jgi:hypothetical protein
MDNTFTNRCGFHKRTRRLYVHYHRNANMSVGIQTLHHGICSKKGVRKNGGALIAVRILEEIYHVLPFFSCAFE